MGLGGGDGEAGEGVGGAKRELPAVFAENLADEHQSESVAVGFGSEHVLE